MRRPAAALGVLLLLAGTAACARRPAASASVRQGAVSPLTPAFAGMRQAVVAGAAPRAAGDVGRLRGLAPEISRRGIALLRARMPHDLDRCDVERFLEGRAAFGEALERWARVTEAPDDAEVLAAWDALVGAFWGWVDVTEGVAPERAV